MIIKKRECILCDTCEEAELLAYELKKEGYRFCSDKPMGYDPRMRGVRWMPDDTFPNCIAIVNDETFDEISTKGTITRPNYTKDRGVVYRVSWYGGAPVGVNLEDLI